MTTDNQDAPDTQARIKKGEQIYKRIASRTGLPVMFGWQASKMSLLIPMNDWNKMSKDEQVSLTYYAENLVQVIRDDPAPYARRWAKYYKSGGQVDSGMEYYGLSEEHFISRVGKLCFTCWDITIGIIKRGEFYDEATPVSGQTAVEFRASAHNLTVKSFDEKDADEFKTFAASMTAGEHMKAASEALESNYNPSQEQFGNTELARKHIKAIPKNAPEFSDAQKLLQRITKRERERKQFQDAVVREVKRLAGTN